MKKGIKKIIGFIIGIGITYILILIYPNLLFAKSYEYRNFRIYSDRPITSEIEFVIDDAIQRLQHSELYEESQNKFKLYLCNDHWRFKLLTRNESAGGVVNFLFSPNIFLRENDLKANQIIPPKSWKNPLADRPLSYFIAHEAVHSLQWKSDRLLILKAPAEIIEGYAEYIAKSTTNDLDKLLQDYKDKKGSMNPKNGLYDKYNLYIGYLIEQKKYDLERIIKEQPSIEVTLKEMITK